MRKSIFGFIGMMILVAGVGFGVLVVRDRQMFSQKAAPSDTTAERIAEIAKSIGQTSPTNISSYSSASLGYRIDFDKNYWKPSQSTDIAQPDLQTLNFSLNDTAGNADVTFKAYGTEDFNKRVTGNVSGGDNLDKIAQSLSASNPPVSKERIRLGGQDYYKFGYNTFFLNVKGWYYQYITVSGTNYYVITAKYSNIGEGRAFTENLISSFSYNSGASSVKGVSTGTDTTSALDESKIVELVKPSVFQIAHVFCTDVGIPSAPELTYLKSSYTFCDGALGSGFAINQDGFIATNGHVVKAYPETALIQALLYGSVSAEPFFLDLIQEVAQSQVGPISREDAAVVLNQVQNDPTTFESFLVLVYNLLQENIMTLSEGVNKYFVKLGADPLKIDTTKSGVDILDAVAVTESVKEATLVSFDFPNQYTPDSVLNNNVPKGSDVAIIKIVNPGSLVFPSVKLGSTDNLKEGSDVIVIGYPGVASGSDSNDSLLNQQSSANPTVTRGIISAIKNDQGGLKLIQVDASIDHGNSGGPGFDAEGNVIGIATYGLQSQSGNYNFLRDIDDLKKLASSNSVSLGESPTYDLWREGLGYFWIQHYRQAEIPFGQLQEDYSIHPSVDEYIADSQDGIKNGQDKSDFLFMIQHDAKTQLLVGGGFLAIVALGVGVIVVIKKKSQKKDIPPMQQQPMPQNPALAQQVPPQTQTVQPDMNNYNQTPNPNYLSDNNPQAPIY